MAAPIAFESSWEKTAERQQLREAREIVLAKAKRDYEKEERRRDEAIQRGEGTWMLPCVSERIDQEQQELAKAKKKKSHKEKKHKKEKKAKKKSKKHGHKRKDEDSSDSDSEDAAMWVEKPALVPSGGSKAPCVSTSADVKGPKLERDSWMSSPLDLLPSVSRDDIRRKKMETTEEEKAKLQQEEEMGRHKRELNPYWKEGGTGLPEEEKEEAGKKSVAAVTGDAGVGWLRSAYKRCEETAAEEGRTLDEVAAERYGSLAKLKKMLHEAEKTLERLKEGERQERYGRREGGRHGRWQDQAGRSSDRGRGRDGRDKVPPRDRATYGSRDRERDTDRDRATGNRDLHTEDRPRRRFMKPGCDNDERSRYPSHHSRVREDHSPGRKTRGFLKPGQVTEQQTPESRQSSSREPRREKQSFKRPADDDHDIDKMYEQRRAELKTRSSSPPSRWRKESALRERRRSNSGNSDSGSSQSESESSSEGEEGKSSPAASQPAPVPPKILSEEEMNRLGAMVLRAEMMGNETLAAELKHQLDEARKTKASMGALPQGGVAARVGVEEGTREAEEVVLTRTDRSGMVRPLPAREYPDESHSGKRRKKPKVETHAKGGERERYFDDDDTYSLKALVEREKLGTAEDQNTMFARLAGRSVEATNDDFQVDDLFVNRAARQQSQSHMESRERQLAIIEHKKMAASLDKCSYCFEKVPKHLIISIGKKVYLCLPNYRSMTEGHCLIVPMMHATQATALDEDVWDEIQVFRKALTRMFMEDDEDCVFMEICTRLKKSPHMVIECVPMPREIGDMAPIYFKKALMESDTEWTENKKVVDLSQKDIRRAVPKGFPYFAVDFGLQGGFAHVIEDEAHFPHYFGREIVGGMLDLEPTMWRKHQKENFDDQRKKVLAFAEKWKPYDWTQRLDSALTGD